MLVDPDSGREIPSPQAMRIEQDTLTKFKKAVDDALTALDASPASNTKVSQQTLAKSAYGQGFTAAGHLSSAYDQAHDNLKTLSQQLGDQLAALAIAVEGASKGYANMDQEQVHELRLLQAKTAGQYQRHHGKHDQTQGGTQLGDGGL